ncbi:MAG: NUDIX hydrolase [Acidimicrobiales bacterium]
MAGLATSMLDTGQRREGVVHAAGGMIVRRTPERELQVAVVHRPLREDWTFPKGKAEADESLEACALREVEEETGLRCKLGAFVGHTEYRDRKDRPKVVAYWIMQSYDGEFAPGREVDEMRWVTTAGAARLLSYERDHELLGALAAAASEAFADDSPAGSPSGSPPRVFRGPA